MYSPGTEVNKTQSHCSFFFPHISRSLLSVKTLYDYKHTLLRNDQKGSARGAPAMGLDSLASKLSHEHAVHPMPHAPTPFGGILTFVHSFFC